MVEAIKDYFRNNYTDLLDQSLIWDAMKAVVRGAAILTSAAMNKQRQEKRQVIIDEITRLERLHKERGGKKIYTTLQAQRRALEMIESSWVQKNLLYLQQKSWRNSPSAIKSLARRVHETRQQRTIAQL